MAISLNLSMFSIIFMTLFLEPVRFKTCRIQWIMDNVDLVKRFPMSTYLLKSVM